MNLHDWGKVTLQMIEFFGKVTPLGIYSGSISRSLAAAYPHTSWQRWIFDEKMPQKYWKKMETQQVEKFNSMII
jgi:hypothetical protein